VKIRSAAAVGQDELRLNESSRDGMHSPKGGSPFADYSLCLLVRDCGWVGQHGRLLAAGTLSLCTVLKGKRDF